MPCRLTQEITAPKIQAMAHTLTPPVSEGSSSSTSGRRRPARHEPSPTATLDENEFVVERIIARSLNKGYGDGRYEYQYLVRWEGYGPEDDTWEMSSNLKQGSAGIVKAYELRQRLHEITIIGQKGDKYHVRYSGAEGSETYSPLAEEVWQTTGDMRKAGIKADQVEETMRAWRNEQALPTPPKSERDSPVTAVAESPRKGGNRGARYLSRQLVKILDMQRYKKSSSQNIKTRFRVVHKLLQSHHRKKGLQTREEWYSANHLANTFSRPVLRAKIKEFMPALMPDEQQVKQEAEGPVLNEYEQERQNMMKENAELMKELGLAS